MPTFDLETFLRHRLEELGGMPLGRQFDFELSVLKQRHSWLSRSAFQAARAGYYGYHPGWNPLASEVSGSAYLRTLAWAALNEGVQDDWILNEAAAGSPIDLGLWRVQSTGSPDWWPSLEPSTDRQEINVDTATILRQVEGVAVSWGSGSYVVLAASGCISQAVNGQHELEVRSFFQQPNGPDRPSSEELFKHLRSARALVDQGRTPLHFNGVVSTETTPRHLSDWLVVPCTGSTNPKANHFWQGWRAQRGIQCPSEVLSESEIHAVCTEDSIDYESEDGLIARWSDWTRDLSALAIGNLPPASGWVLVAPRKVVGEFAEKTGMNLAWAWEVASYFREYAHGDFKEFRMHGDQGTSQIIPV
ncbi:MAG: hypothetical protein OXH85_10540 [Truepera sp.]|nr:hypothetical protein [Truepera sp.]